MYVHKIAYKTKKWCLFCGEKAAEKARLFGLPPELHFLEKSINDKR